ncbi:MAG: sulfatase-like hydrolase/transferase [Planctomycetota bacterium]
MMTATVARGDAAASDPAMRPNVLWITLEDISPNLGCYGDPDAATPNIDRLAAQGIRYTRASSNAGMCAVARATLITGMYPTSTGAMHMRSQVRLPESIRAYPEFLRRAGYYCSNHSKTDYNWIAPAETWDINSPDWRQSGWRRRAAGQPFFTVINITDTHSSQLYFRGEHNWRRRVASLPPSHRHDPAGVTVPPYYPDTPEVRGDLARYHDNISHADKQVQTILDQLQQDGLADDTIVFFFSDHGMGMPRAKSWCFESSLRVPLIIRFPRRWRALAPGGPGSTEDRQVSFVDFAPTLLSLCGVKLPRQFQGVAFLGPDAGPPRTHQYTYRDRMDERYDLIRGVSDGRWKYIRNFLPHLPYFHTQTRLYPAKQPTYQVLHRMAAEGSLPPTSAQFLTHQRPREQLFDLKNDPHELVNLVDDPRYASHKNRLRRKLWDWMIAIKDLGFMPESAWTSRFTDHDDDRPLRNIIQEDPSVYPLERIIEVADAVGRGTSVRSLQRSACEDSDASVRYWGAVGLTAQSSLDEASLQMLQKQLTDEIPSCRIAAAEALLQHRFGEREAIGVLVDVAQSENQYARLLAINVLHRHSDAIPTNAAEPLGFLLKEKTDDWIKRSQQKTIQEILSRNPDAKP